jgi:hypothetical protein
MAFPQKINNVLYTAFTVAIKGGEEKECAAVMAYGIQSKVRITENTQCGNALFLAYIPS